MAYAGPYTDTAEGPGSVDARNFWTFLQETVTAQVPEVPAVEISPESGAFAQPGGSDTFSVTMTGPGLSRSWTVDKDSTAGWLALVSPPLQTPQFDDGSVAYSVVANDSGAARAANFYVNGKTYTVSQAA